jgi:hypothetical protein
MRRRCILALLAILIIAVLTVQGSDFWLTKDWKQWSKGDCEGLLLESPWSHVWRYRAEPSDPNLPHAMVDQLFSRFNFGRRRQSAKP